MPAGAGFSVQALYLPMKTMPLPADLVRCRDEGHLIVRQCGRTANDIPVWTCANPDCVRNPDRRIPTPEEAALARAQRNA